MCLLSLKWLSFYEQLNNFSKWKLWANCACTAEWAQAVVPTVLRWSPSCVCWNVKKWYRAWSLGTLDGNSATLKLSASSRLIASWSKSRLYDNSHNHKPPVQSTKSQQRWHATGPVQVDALRQFTQSQATGPVHTITAEMTCYWTSPSRGSTTIHTITSQRTSWVSDVNSAWN